MSTGVFRGTVTRKLLGAGTKSEHEALVLVTPAGEYRLRRPGGNPFWDESLAPLEGKEIECEGRLQERVLFLSGYRVLDEK